MELKLNESYYDKELAEWFGVTAQGFSKNKAKFLEELKLYCDYEIVGNKRTKTKILDIKYATYNKTKTRSNRQKVVGLLSTEWGKGNGAWGLDKDDNVVKKIILNHPEEKIDLEFDTARKYVNTARRTNSKLLSSWELAKYKIDPATGIKAYEPFTPEELEKKKEIYQHCFSGAENRKIQEESYLNYEAYKAGDISKEEYDEKDSQLKERSMCYWVQYKQLVAEMCNAFVERAANVIESAF